MSMPSKGSSEDFTPAANKGFASTVERREFLTGAVVTGTAIAASFPGDRSFAAEVKPSSARNRPRVLSDFECDDFRAIIGEEFAVSGQAESSQESLRLVVRDVVNVRHATDANRPSGLRPSGYIVQFAARSGRLGDEGTYRLHHIGLEASSVYLQPSRHSGAADEPMYEAVFN